MLSTRFINQSINQMQGAEKSLLSFSQPVAWLLSTYCSTSLSHLPGIFCPRDHLEDLSMFCRCGKRQRAGAGWMSPAGIIHLADGVFARQSMRRVCMTRV